MSLIENANGYAAAFQASDTTTDEMRKAIALWFEMYYRSTPTKTHDPLPADRIYHCAEADQNDFF